jgi:hypothetical protein
MFLNSPGFVNLGETWLANTFSAAMLMCHSLPSPADLETVFLQQYLLVYLAPEKSISPEENDAIECAIHCCYCR